MILRKIFVAILTMVVLGYSTRTRAQYSHLENALTMRSATVMGPLVNPITGQSYFGFDLGLTGTGYVGNNNFLWHLNSPDGSISSYSQFDNLGSGLGYLLGAKIGIPLTSRIDFQLKARYFTNHTSTSESHPVSLAPGNSAYDTKATNSFALTTANIGAAALLDFGITDMIYGIAGLGYSSITSNNFVYHQELDASGPSYPDFSTQLPSGVYALDQPGVSLPDYLVSSRFDAQLGVGAAQRIGTGSTMLDFEFLLSVPLTSWLTTAKQAHLDSVAAFYTQQTISYPKLWYASFTLGIRFPFGANSDADVADYRASQTTNSGPATSSQEIPDAEGKVPLSGRVTNSKTGDPVDATMTVVDLTTNEVVATDRTDRNGYYKVRVKAPGKYSVTADADGYLFGSSYFDVDENGRILATHKDIKLSEATTGRTRLLVFFDFNKADLKSASIPELNRAVHLMKAVPSMQVEIAGYTDNVGTSDYNKDLSLRRAVAVKDYLVAHGVPKSRVSAAGYGADSPIADNSTEEGRAENRRVEFVVTSK